MGQLTVTAHSADGTQATGSMQSTGGADALEGDDALPTLPSDRFLNRELSWLQFNSRVLALANDSSTPLLERAKFLAIFASNLDEFFMVRVAGLHRRIATGLATFSPDGLSPRDQLEQVSRRTQELVAEHARILLEDVLPELVKEGIDILRWDEVTDEDREELHRLFREQVFPVLTPLAVDPAHPFPYISGLSLNLAVILREPGGQRDRFARVKVPPLLPRFVKVGGTHFVPLEDVIAAHLDQLFPGMEVVQHDTFRVTRNADLEVDEDESQDLIEALERELLRRRFGPPVRLEVESSMSSKVLDLLVHELNISDSDVYRVPGPLDLSGLWAIHGLERPELKDPPFVPATQPRLAQADAAKQRSIFAVLRDDDIVVHHPYDSFATSVTAFVAEAAADPQVLAIKQTLYRTSGESPIVDALVDAAEAGKEVVVVVEIKARFDEAANIRWARELERAGCHVVYGLVGLKTHCKAALVVRQETEGLRLYAHIGTGNYHPKTARLYEDFGILTADPKIGADLSDLFNQLTGYSHHADYSRLLVAPQSLRRGVIDRIEREVAHQEAGRPARIVFKLNSLVDEQVVDALYEASRAGVQVDLLVRGMCVVRPGVPGLSASITVRSIVGRFLEHSRVLYFANGGDDECWIGSADMMHRNLDRRVELLLQVCGDQARAQLRETLALALRDDIDAWDLQPDGNWVRRADAAGASLPNYQSQLIRQVHKRGASASA